MTSKAELSDLYCNIPGKIFQCNFEINNFSFRDLYVKDCVESHCKYISIKEHKVILTLLFGKVRMDNTNVKTSDIFEFLLRASIKKGYACVIGTKFELAENQYFKTIESSTGTGDSFSKILSSTYNESENFVFVVKSKPQYQLKWPYGNVWSVEKNTRVINARDDTRQIEVLVTVSGTIMIPELQSDTSVNIPKLQETNLGIELTELFHQPEHSDIEICVNGKNFSAHKGILHARSKGFAELLQNTETNGNIIYINDFSEEVVKEALRFIYTGKCECVKSIACELLQFAEKFQILGLEYLCELEIQSSIDISNACEFVD